ncbi:hypothetical protein CEXT_599791 [Caerostris extrusa]|uniref:Uncharacterized protein n=1 Tax=Caerostris extrusa TaxID=172846 RepID=A0AAV4MDK6_CAEEX|nr:hypothetical protein CEXT_599791 [Caerostris extrusa]
MIGEDNPRKKKVPIPNSSTVSSRHGTQSSCFLRQIFGEKLFRGISQTPPRRKQFRKNLLRWRKENRRGKIKLQMKFKENKNPLSTNKNPFFKKTEQELNCGEMMNEMHNKAYLFAQNVVFFYLKSTSTIAESDR